jgi:hypothetical protein
MSQESESARRDVAEQLRWFRDNRITPREALVALGVTLLPSEIYWETVRPVLEAALRTLRNGRARRPRAAA